MLLQTYSKIVYNYTTMARGLSKRLTDKQISFAQKLVYNEGRMTPTECAIEAGYDKDSAHVRASELKNPRKYPLVAKYIGELREEIQKKYEITFEKHVAELAKLRDASRHKGAWSAAINAEIARGKAAGLYVDQKIIKYGSLDQLSEDELQAKMKQILEDHKTLIEGVDYQVHNDTAQEEHTHELSSNNNHKEED